MQLSAVIAEKIKHKHSQKESNFPLPSLTSALPLCSRHSSYPTPATRAEAWQAIPGVSEWVMGDNKTRLFTPIRSKTPALQRRGLHLCAGRERSRSALRVMTLLEKGAIEMVSPALSESGFYSRYSSSPKRMAPPAHPRSQTPESRLHETAVQDDHTEADPLADLHRGLVLFLWTWRWHTFHPDSPPSQTILEIRLEGVAYQYTVLPFGLSLAPRTFTKCMDAALSPLRQMGIRILNYLDDWLILAQSEVELLSHSNPHPQPLRAPGAQGQFSPKAHCLPANEYRSWVQFWTQPHMRAVIAPERALAIQKLAATFKSDTARPLKVFRECWALWPQHRQCYSWACSACAPFNAGWTTGSTQRMASRTLAYQGESGLCNSPDPLEEPTVDGEGRGHGVGPHQESCHDTGWGALCEGKPTFGHWSKTESGFHINCLEMLAVCRACQFFPAGPTRTPCADSLRQQCPWCPI